jgi:hypothetical protein
MVPRAGTGASEKRKVPSCCLEREVHVTGHDEVIIEQAKVDGVVNFVQSSKVFVLCFEHHGVYN